MPSLRAICVGLLLTPLLQLSSGAPAAPAPDCPLPGQAPALPSTGNAVELPAPTLALKYVAIGRGVQNYTCARATSPPVAIGAIATLYDATFLAYSSTTALHAIPPMAVMIPQPKGSASIKVANSVLEPLGNHYFDASGTPVFDLTAVKKSLFAAKAANTTAPANASKGPGGQGAVDWLYLTSKKGYTSVGLGAVYRVVTAGGKAVCTQPGPQSVQYAAEYWFYG
ncbi:hypothetical protein ONS95_003130 [Cadophora gregata]|uniref:uncharacterized protein n=1 Tax=Cadophora gregata TaxID=51156 RepID=UPI0026DD6312|nr:uncharacterized protein ONS95_003130 [Cadophora gregata]KAK0108314.1 hypothetical protein ONS95_003130 [Cadophora gregata]